MRLKKHLTENVGMTVDQTGTYLSVMVYLPLFSIVILWYSYASFPFPCRIYGDVHEMKFQRNCSLDRQYVIRIFKRRKNIEVVF